MNPASVIHKETYPVPPDHDDYDLTSDWDKVNFANEMEAWRSGLLTRQNEGVKEVTATLGLIWASTAVAAIGEVVGAVFAGWSIAEYKTY